MLLKSSAQLLGIMPINLVPSYDEKESSFKFVIFMAPRSGFLLWGGGGSLSECSNYMKISFTPKFSADELLVYFYDEEESLFQNCEFHGPRVLVLGWGS